MVAAHAAGADAPEGELVHREVQPALDSIYGVEAADAQAALDSIADRVNELIAFVPGE